MIQLGSFDDGVAESARKDYVKLVEASTRVPLAQVKDGPDKIGFKQCAPGGQEPMSVAELQQGLKFVGFLPGGNIDGICGYRTLSAMRLFQEYVRTYEKLPSLPDGRFGAPSQAHLKRWIDNGVTSEWAPAMAAWEAGTPAESEYTQWLSLLEKVKEKYTGAPSPMLQLVNAFGRPVDTRKVGEWDFTGPGNIHLIGVRRTEASGKFDDVFVLLIRGLVFKFQGSTEPGATSNPAGLPFLVQGQHDYHFGWHQQSYLALRPQHLDRGILVVRSKGDRRLDDADLKNGLEANASINIHWGGKGLKFDVKTWSEGCQVINGSLYLNDRGDLVDCTAFAATNNGEVAANPARTRGAYNALADLVIAFSSDLAGGAVKYTLLVEADLDLDPALKQGLEDARAKVQRLLG